jgi:hypothetical protein
MHRGDMCWASVYLNNAGINHDKTFANKKDTTMTYNSFEDLPVWQKAAELFEQTDEFLDHGPSRLRHSFRDQLERAVLSVSNNIAEGFERGTTRELLQFI